MLTVAEQEITMEKLRQDLAFRAAFEPYAAFSRIDRDNKGWISSLDLRSYLADNGYIHLLEQECNYIIKYFDSAPQDHPYSRLDYQE